MSEHHPDHPETTGPEAIVGHKTFWHEDGTHHHEPLRRDEAEAILASADAAKAKRASDMPTEQDAINALFEAHQRLKELGWREASYCPKDGSSFNAIETGSTGIFRCHYSGDWPEGSWWLEDAGDLWPSRPTLYKLDPEAEAARKAKIAEAAARFRAEMEADGVEV
jgi:hypothetical protein